MKTTNLNGEARQQDSETHESANGVTEAGRGGLHDE